MIDFKNTILLTGAGFTANFGGYLAKEMWSKIFNNPLLEDTRNIKAELRNNLDFENVYSKVFDNNSNFSVEENKAFEKALNDAYIRMDETIKIPFIESQGINPENVKKFIKKFINKDTDGVGMCFTLNQDLCLERKLEFQPLGPLLMRYKESNGKLDEKDINPNNFKILPTREELELYKSQFQSFSEDFCYVKLHGSLGWITGDGKDSKVIGINKLETINNVPLLKWYFELFQNALNRKNVKLLVIGYGFRDKHINQCLYEAVKNHYLKIFVISPTSPKDFYFNLSFKYPRGAIMNEPNEIGKEIWNGIEGYFPYQFKDIFPLDQLQPDLTKEIYESLNIK